MLDCDPIVHSNKGPHQAKPEKALPVGRVRCEGTTEGGGCPLLCHEEQQSWGRWRGRDRDHRPPNLRYRVQAGGAQTDSSAGKQHHNEGKV